MKPKIICIVGLSGCGKTSLTKEIEKQLNIPSIVSYTTRPMRDGETDGVEHIFVGEKEFDELGVRFAYTEFGGYRYCTTLKQLTKHPVCTYVIDERGLLEIPQLIQRAFNIIPVYVERHISILQNTVDQERLKRDEDRMEYPRDKYKAVIKNNGSYEEFIEKGIRTIKKLVYGK